MRSETSDVSKFCARRDGRRARLSPSRLFSSLSRLGGSLALPILAIALLLVVAPGCTDSRAPATSEATSSRATESPTIGPATSKAPGTAAAKEPAATPEPVASARGAALLDRGTWPVFRRTATSTGVADSPLVGDPALIWTLSVKDGMFEGTPAIADGVVYIAGLGGDLFALELATGRVLWTFHSELGFRAPAAVRDKLVYIGDTEGRFACLDAATGKPQWGLSTEAEINAGANFYKDNVLIGSQDGSLYCLDAKTGTQVWKYTIENMIQCSPTIVENRVFLAGCDQMLHIIDVDTGQAVDKLDIQDPTGVTPAAAGDMLYFGTQGAKVFGINWREAKIVWVYEHDKRKSPYQSSPAVAEDLVVIGGRDRMVHAIHAASGEKAWTFPTRSRIDSSPVIVGDRVYVGTGDGRLYGLKLATGEKVWEYEAGGDFVGSPAIAAGRLVIANGNGNVLCFGEAEGAP